MDKDVTSPSDYTVMVEGLGSDFDPKEVVRFFEEHGREDESHIEVEGINVAYDIHDFVELGRKRFKVSSKLVLLEEYERRGEDIPRDTFCFCIKGDQWNEEILKHELHAIDSYIKKYEESKPDLKVGKVFITCKK